MESTPSPLAKAGFLGPLRDTRPLIGPWRRQGGQRSRDLAMEAAPGPDGTRLRLSGSLTARTAVSFKHAVARLSTEAGILIIDMQEVPRLDPTGLAALAAATEIGQRQGCRVVVSNLPEGARRRIAQASLHKVIELGE